jgi:NTE family protein
LAFKTSPPEAADRLLQADLILGTSAGAIVGTQLGSGVGLADLYARQLSVSIDQTPPRLDVTALMTVFEAAAADTNGSITQRLKMVGLPCHIPVFPSGAACQLIQAHGWPAMPPHPSPVPPPTCPTRPPPAQGCPSGVRP